MSKTENIVRVWDPLVRIFHWSLVASFMIAYLTEDDWMELHEWAGYVVLGLIIFRVVWGVVGTKHARFSDFVSSPKTVINYLKDIIGSRAKRHIGHNPAGGAMVLALLIVILMTGISGVVLYGYHDYAGPLAGWMTHLPRGLDEPLEEIHEFLANFSVFLVILHLVGVALASFQHGENLPKSMLTGRKIGDL